MPVESSTCGVRCGQERKPGSWFGPASSQVSGGPKCIHSFRNKSPLTGRHKSTEIHFLLFWGPELQNLGVSRPCSRQGLQGRIFPGLLQLLVVPGAPWLVATSLHLCPCLHTAFSLMSLCPKSPLHFSNKYLLLAHPGNPGLSHLEILKLITSAKTLFPNTVTLTDSDTTLTYLFFLGGVVTIQPAGSVM